MKKLRDFSFFTSLLLALAASHHLPYILHPIIILRLKCHGARHFPSYIYFNFAIQFVCIVRREWDGPKSKSILFISCLIVQKFFFSNFWLSFFFHFASQNVVSEACLNSSFLMLTATNETSFTDFLFLLPYFLLSFNSPSSAALANAMSVFKVKIQMSKKRRQEGW